MSQQLQRRHLFRRRPIFVAVAVKICLEQQRKLVHSVKSGIKNVSLAPSVRRCCKVTLFRKMVNRIVAANRKSSALAVEKRLSKALVFLRSARSFIRSVFVVLAAKMFCRVVCGLM
jgi:hypothetical protein